MYYFGHFIFQLFTVCFFFTIMTLELLRACKCFTYFFFVFIFVWFFFLRLYSLWVNFSAFHFALWWNFFFLLLNWKKRIHELRRFQFTSCTLYHDECMCVYAFFCDCISLNFARFLRFSISRNFRLLFLYSSDCVLFLSSSFPITSKRF